MVYREKGLELAVLAVGVGAEVSEETVDFRIPVVAAAVAPSSTVATQVATLAELQAICVEGMAAMPTMTGVMDNALEEEAAAAACRIQTH